MPVPHVVLTALALTLVAQAPLPTKADALAGLYGETLGAASSCPGLPRDRLDTVTSLTTTHLKAELEKPETEAVAGEHLAGGIERGRRAIATGSETCAQALSEFDNLERDLKR